jgi:hypothetical protein
MNVAEWLLVASAHLDIEDQNDHVVAQSLLPRLGIETYIDYFRSPFLATSRPMIHG